MKSFLSFGMYRNVSSARRSKVPPCGCFSQVLFASLTATVAANAGFLLSMVLSAVDRCPLTELVGTLRSDDGDGKRNATKAIGLISKTTILHVHHAFLNIFLPSLHDYDVKMPNFTMYRGSTQATTKFPLSF